LVELTNNQSDEIEIRR